MGAVVAARAAVPVGHDPAALTQVLGVVYRTIPRRLIGKAGLTRTGAAAGAVMLIQRFGSALNPNIHFHMLFPDGAYLFKGAPAGVPPRGRAWRERAAAVGRADRRTSGEVQERRGRLAR